MTPLRRPVSGSWHLFEASFGCDTYLMQRSRSHGSRGGGSPAAKEQASQTARAFTGIRELLLLGEFHPGDRISELPLSARLGVSRTPIRLALERLANIGLLRVGRNGGFFVRGFTIPEVRDALELRAVLEGTAARLAAERTRDPGELAKLRFLRDEAEQAADLSLDLFHHYMDRNESFHAHVVELAQSDMLRQMLETVYSLPFAAPSAMVFPTSMLAASDRMVMIAQEQHRALYEAIANREGARAEFLAREHARLGWRVFELVLSNGGPQAFKGVPGVRLIEVSSDRSDGTAASPLNAT
jgi:GntR family transcriptional regulator, vanillate catabolism transcriptional regulator